MKTPTRGGAYANRAREALETFRKRCTKCGETKWLDEYTPNHSRLDGRRSECRACTWAHRKEYVKRYWAARLGTAE